MANISPPCLKEELESINREIATLQDAEQSTAANSSGTGSVTRTVATNEEIIEVRKKSERDQLPSRSCGDMADLARNCISKNKVLIGSSVREAFRVGARTYLASRYEADIDQQMHPRIAKVAQDRRVRAWEYTAELRGLLEKRERFPPMKANPPNEKRDIP